MMRKLAVLALLCLGPIQITSMVTSENPIARSLKNYEPDIEPYEDRLKPARPIFNYRKNGVKIDVRIVPATNDTIVDDRFPEFPAQDFTQCLFDLSMSCFRDRMARFIDTIGRLDEIKLWGSGIKLVKTRARPKNIIERRMLDNADGGVGKIDRSIEDFFDAFALRINLPRSNGKRERNQIDVMFDDNGVIEGRGKGGGGGKGGGKCKKMMMMMVMMGKMKLMAWAGMMSMKGMMMAGMSLMISKAMLIMKLMSLKMGKGGGGGGGYGGGGGQLKEIVLLTKASGGGGGGGGGYGAVMDSYGAPPPSSYGAPSSGGGGYDYSGGGGGGGWGRSFNDRISMSSQNEQPDIIYPSTNLSHFYQNLDAISSNPLINNSLSDNGTARFNDSALWNSWKSLNSSNDVLSIQNTRTDAKSSSSESNEFQAPKKAEPDEKIDKGGREVHMNYAKKWKNYEIADRILSPTRVVAMRRTSRVDRAPTSIPISA